jgi:hypothetical protein
MEILVSGDNHKVSYPVFSLCMLECLAKVHDTAMLLFHFRKPGNATSQRVIMAGNKIGLLTIYGTKKHKKILPVRTKVGRGTVW